MRRETASLKFAEGLLRNSPTASRMSTALDDFLSTLPAGPLFDRSVVEGLLRDLWDNFGGSDEGGMQAYKLSGRCEDLCWQPPYLTFSIERHGCTVNGSSRAEVQKWRVDLSTGTASIVSTGRRQLEPMSPRLNVKPLADKIARAIINEQKSQSLKRCPDGRVKVLIGTVIPEDTYPQTVAGRRRRFRKALESLLEAGGWVPAEINTYNLAGSFASPETP